MKKVLILVLSAFFLAATSGAVFAQAKETPAEKTIKAHKKSHKKLHKKVVAPKTATAPVKAPAAK